MEVSCHCSFPSLRPGLPVTLKPILTGISCAGAVRHAVIYETEALVKKTNFPYFVTSMGKGAITEHLPSFGGVYGGAGSLPEIKQGVEGSDCVLWVGNYPVSLTKGYVGDGMKWMKLIYMWGVE